MKRRGAPLGESRPQRKKPASYPGEDGQLPYKLQMLQNWEITPEAARFLEINDRISGSRVSDATCPQLCLMVYAPNLYQPLIDALAFPAQPEPMDIETV
jgi:hypothetical protein